MLPKLLVALTFLALAVPAPARARDVLRERSSRVVEAAGLSAVSVDLGHGDLRASPSADGKVHVTAHKLVRSRSREESLRLSREVRVETAHQGSQFVIRVRHPGQRSIRVGLWDLFHDFEMPNSSIVIQLELPSGLPLYAAASSGDIETERLTAPQSIRTASGDVDIHAAGAVQVSTSSGDLQLDGVARTYVRTVSGDAVIESARGPVDAHTTSGDLRVHEAADSLLIGTVSGDLEVDGASRGLAATTTNGEIHVDRAAGRVQIGTSSGGVDLHVVPPLGEVSVTTGSGDIDLRIDRRIGARLELRTSNGSLLMDEPIQGTSLSRRRATGQLRKGSTPILLRSASGDIHVMTGETGS
jgi:hypothetical protein